MLSRNIIKLATSPALLLFWIVAAPNWSLQADCPRYKDVAAGPEREIIRQPDASYRDFDYNGFMATLKDVRTGKLTLVAGQNPLKYGRSVIAIHGINDKGTDTFYIQYLLNDRTSCETTIDVPSIALSSSKEVKITHSNTWADFNSHKP
jgi:hypothetical protein